MKINEILPKNEIIKIRSEADYYGISHQIARQLKLPFVPRSLSCWKHGWLYGDLVCIEQLATQKNASNYLVANKEQEFFLKERGMSANAVGMPFIYFDEKQTTRNRNTLLVMPPHSLPYNSHDWDEMEYVKEISLLKDKFDGIVACIHFSCVDKGYWIKSFEKFGIPWVSGADVYDRNSLIKMQRLFRSFEYMTTPTIGSHILYAAYCGCKVSIYGKYIEYSKDDFVNDPFYMQYPKLLEYNMVFSSESFLREKYGFLFCFPSEATSLKKWADYEIGLQYKKSFVEIAILLGWTPKGQFNLLVFFIKNAIFKIKKLICKES